MVHLAWMVGVFVSGFILTTLCALSELPQAGWRRRAAQALMFGTLLAILIVSHIYKERISSWLDRMDKRYTGTV